MWGDVTQNEGGLCSRSSRPSIDFYRKFFNVLGECLWKILNHLSSGAVTPSLEHGLMVPALGVGGTPPPLVPGDRSPFLTQSTTSVYLLVSRLKYVLLSIGNVSQFWSVAYIRSPIVFPSHYTEPAVSSDSFLSLLKKKEYNRVEHSFIMNVFGGISYASFVC